MFNEIKRIAMLNAKRNRLIQKLHEDGFDEYGINWDTAKLVTLSKDDIKYFEQHNGVTDEYYVVQHAGYCEDDFYGTLWFKTDVPGQYVQVSFSC